MAARIFDDVVEIIKPYRDSQFLLLPCECGSCEVVYARYIGTRRAEQSARACECGYMWRVVCTDCGAVVDIKSTTRHPVQIEWNQKHKKEEVTCKD